MARSDGTLRFETRIDNSGARKDYANLKKQLSAQNGTVEVKVELSQESMAQMAHEVAQGCARTAEQVDKTMAGGLGMSDTIDAMTSAGEAAGEGFGAGAARTASEIDSRVAESTDLSGTVGIFGAAGVEAGKLFSAACQKAFEAVGAQMEAVLRAAASASAAASSGEPARNARTRQPIRFHGMVEDDAPVTDLISPDAYREATDAISELDSRVADLGLSLSRIDLNEIPFELRGPAEDFADAMGVTEAREALEELKKEWDELKTDSGYSDEGMDAWLVKLEEAQEMVAQIQQDLNTLSMPEGYKDYYGLRSPEEREKAYQEYWDGINSRARQAADELGKASEAAASAPKEGEENMEAGAKAAESAASSLRLVSREAEVADRKVARLQQEYDALAKRQGELKATGNGLGHAEYDANLVRMSEIKAQLQEYQKELINASAKAGQFGRALSGALSALPGIAKAAFSAFSSAAHAAFSGLSSISGRAFGALADSAKGAVAKISGMLASLGRKAASALSGLFSPIQGRISRIFGLTKTSADKANVSLGKLIKTILKYGLGIRSLYVLFNKFRSLTVSGFERLAQASEETNGAISRIKTAINGLGNSVAAALNPVLQAIEPIITRMINSLSRMIDNFGMLIASLTGQSTYTRVIDRYEDYAKSLEKQAKKKEDQAKKKYLSGLDEMRRWESDKNDDDDADKPQASTVQIEEALPDAFKKLRDLLKNHDWEGLGAYIADAINRGLAKAYKAIQEWTPKILGVIDAFCRTFNSMVRNMDWDLLGRVAGAAINLLAAAVNHLVDGIDWVNLGRSLATALNGLLDEVDWYELGRALGAKIKVLTDLFYGFLTNVDWAALGTALGQLLNGFITRIDFGRMAEAFIAGVNGLTSAIDAFIETYHWGELADNFAAGVNKIFSPEGVDWQGLGASLMRLAVHIGEELSQAINGIDWASIGKGIAGFINGALSEFDPAKAAALINAAFQAFFDTVRGFVDELDWEGIGYAITDTISEALNGADPESWGKTAAKFCNRLFRLLRVTALSMPWKQIGTNAGTLIRSFFEEADFSGWAEALTLWLNGLAGEFKAMGEAVSWDEVGRAAADMIRAFFETGDFAGWGETLNTWIQGLLDALVAATDPENQNYQAIGDSIGDFLSAIDWASALEKLGTVLGNVLGGVFEGIFKNPEASPAGKFATALLGALGGLGIADKIAGMFGQGSALDAAFSFLAEHPVLMATGAIIGVANALGAFDDISVDWDGIKESIGGAMDRISSVFADTVDGEAVRTAGSNIAAGVGAIVDAAVLAAPGIFEGITEIVELMALVAGGLIDGAAAIINGIADAIRALADSALVKGLGDLNTALNGIFGYGGGVSTAEAQEAIDGYSESLGKLAAYGDEEAFGIVRDAIASLSDTNLYDPTNLNSLAIDLDNAALNGAHFDDWAGNIASVLGNTGVPLSEFNSLIGETSGGLEQIGTNAEEAASQIGAMQSVASDTAEAAGSIGEFLSALEQSTDISDYEKLTALIDALESTTETTGDTDGSLSGLADQMRTVQSNDGNFSGYIDDIASKLETAGVNSGTFRDSLVSAIKQMGADVPQELTKVSSSIDGLAPDFEKSGEGLASATGGGYASGMADEAPSMEKAGADATQKTVAAMEKDLGIQGGKAAKTIVIGKAADAGLGDGMDKNIAVPEKAAANVADKGVLQAMDKALGISGNTSAKTREIGVVADNSLAGGMDSAQPTVESSATDVGQAALDALDRTLSPQAAQTRGNAFMDALAAAISSKAGALGDAMTAALQPAETAMARFAENIGRAFDGINAPLNSFIGKLNGLLYGVQYMQNEIARLLSFNVVLPAEVAQIVGYSGLAMEVPRLTTSYQIPYLAKGAVIPPNSPFMAVLGDQNRGTNVEAPLETIKQALSETLAGFASSAASGLGFEGLAREMAKFDADVLRALDRQAKSLEAIPAQLASDGISLMAAQGLTPLQMPAMAAGGVVPPGASYAAAGRDRASDGTSMEAVRQAVRAVIAETGAARQQKGQTKLINTISGRVFLEVMLEEGKNMMMQSGVNPFTAISSGA